MSNHQFRAKYILVLPFECNIRVRKGDRVMMQISNAFASHSVEPIACGTVAKKKRKKEEKRNEQTKR